MHIDYKAPGGKLLRIDADLIQGRISNLQLNGDFFIHPEEVREEIEKALEGIRPEDADDALMFLDDVQMVGISRQDICKALESLR